MSYFIIVKSYSAVLHVSLDFHLIVLLLGNINLYCFYLIKALLWLLKDTFLVSVFKFSIFLKPNLNSTICFGVKRPYLKPRNIFRKWWKGG